MYRSATIVIAIKKIIISTLATFSAVVPLLSVVYKSAVSTSRIEFSRTCVVLRSNTKVDLLKLGREGEDDGNNKLDKAAIAHSEEESSN